MEDKSLPDIISQILPDEVEKSLGFEKAKPVEQDNVLIASLRAAAGQSGGQVEASINQFLNGEGELLETTRSAVTRSKTTAKNEVAAFLEKKFNLSPTVAKLVAMLVVKLFPSISKLTGNATTEKKKPRNKKPKTSTTTSKKKPKKKTTSKPKTTASKPAAKKKKPAAKDSKKATTKKKPKKTRSVTIDGGSAEG